MPGPYVHHIDPVIATIGGLHLWWYGLSYSLGFVNAHLFLRRNRDRLGLSLADVHELSFLIAAARSRPFRPLFDALAIPAAFILGCGRIGNFIDGQIVGGVTTLPWGVQFPDAAGFRHPVVLYDGLKNFLIIPILWSVQSRGVPPGRVGSLFVLLYAALRIPIDLLREYPISFLFLPAGQTFNVLMALAGAALLAKNVWWPAAPPPLPARAGASKSRSVAAAGAFAFAALVLISLVIPSDATRDIPARYGHRHAGLSYSRIYLRIGAEPQMVSHAGSAINRTHRPTLSGSAGERR